MMIAAESIRLSGSWFALLFLYLIGDVIRLYEKGEMAGWIDGKQMDQLMLMLAALILLAPLVMAVLCLFAPFEKIRFISIIMSALLFLLNAAGVMSYSSHYDRFLIILGLLLNLFIIFQSVRT